MVGDYIVVQFLEHEVGVAGDALVRQMDHGADAARRGISLGKGVGAGGHHGPHPGRRNIGELLPNIISVIESDRDVLFQQGVVILAVHLGSHTRLNGYDGGDVVGVPSRLPAGHTALGVGDQDGVLAGALVYFVNGSGHRLGHHGVIDVLVAIGVIHAGVVIQPMRDWP